MKSVAVSVSRQLCMPQTALQHSHLTTKLAAKYTADKPISSRITMTVVALLLLLLLG
jgi:hypothetical protein